MILRWVVPIVFFGAAWWVRDFNGAHLDQQYVFPGVALLSGPDLRAQGELTWKVVLGIGAVLLLWNVIVAVQDARAKRSEG